MTKIIAALALVASLAVPTLTEGVDWTPQTVAGDVCALPEGCCALPEGCD